MKQLINDYYFLCGLLDDNIEMLASFIKFKNITKHRRSSLIIFFENLRLKNVEKEINIMLDFKMSEFKEYKIVYTNEQLRLKAKNEKLYQSYLWDFYQKLLQDYFNTIEIEKTLQNKIKKTNNRKNKKQKIAKGQSSFILKGDVVSLS